MPLRVSSLVALLAVTSVPSSSSKAQYSNVRSGFSHRHQHPNGSQTNFRADRNNASISNKALNGNQSSAQFSTDRRGNFVLDGSHQTNSDTTYNARIARHGNSTQVGAEYRRPGTIPGTQERYNGNLNFQGRNSQAQFGGELYDATGSRRVVTNQTHLDRNGIQRNANGRIMGANVNQNGNLSFQGRNSQFETGKNVNLGGVANTSTNFQANSRGVSGGGSIGVRGANVGFQASANTSGINARVNTPTFQTPRLPSSINVPKVNTPQVNAPKINAPQINPPRINTPQLSTPRISSPSINVPKVSPPKVDLPKISAPKISAPKISAPKIKKPRF